MTGEEAVRDALRAYMECLVTRLRDEGFALPPKDVRGSGWVAAGDNDFILRDYDERQLQLQRFVDAMEGTTEYRRAIDALRSDPVIGPRLDTLVSGWSLEGGTIPAMLAHAILSNADDLSIDGYDDAFGPLYEWLTREGESVIVIAPLSGLACDDVPDPPRVGHRD